jgi:drug/metabolite transporter (DMT)-like permease
MGADPPAGHLTRGYAIALAAAATLSTTAIFIRYLTVTYDIPALVLAFWRDVFVCLTLLPVLALLRPLLLRVTRRHLGYLVGYGLVLAAFNALWTLSVALNGAAAATVLVYSSAAFTAVGIVTGVLSGLGYAAYSLMGRSASQRGLNPWTTVLYTFAFATAFLLVFNLLPGAHLPGAATRPADLFWLRSALAGWGILFLLAAGPTLGGFGLYNVSLSYLPSSVANLIVTMEPAFTVVIAYLVLGERLTGTQLVGGAMIVTGVAFLRIYEGWMQRWVRTSGARESGAAAAR